jgi:hypothetical protein
MNLTPWSSREIFIVAPWRAFVVREPRGLRGCPWRSLKSVQKNAFFVAEQMKAFLELEGKESSATSRVTVSSRRYQPALPVSRDIKGEAATAAAISIGSWFSGRLLKCVMKSEKGGNSPIRSSSG